jgi:hypothetical protein
VGSNPLLRKITAAMGEPDDLVIWRYAALDRPIRDIAWSQHVNSFRVREKIQRAKEDGTWDNFISIFLRRAANGDVPISAFMSDDGRSLLNDIARQLDRNITKRSIAQRKKSAPNGS